MVTIRPATDGDREAIARVHVAAIYEQGSAAYEHEQVDAWAADCEPEGYPLADDDVTFVVATVDGTVAGFGMLAHDDGEVTAVYVDPEHARAGVGSTLLESLETAAREAGLDRLTLRASNNAIGFYEKQGWSAVTCVEHETTGGVILECTQFEKRL